MKINILRTLICFCISSSCQAFDCNTDASEITDAVRIPSDHSGYEVIAAGRSYFYNAPMSTCIDKQIFLVKNDHIDAYFDYGEFTYVMFIHPKTGKDTSGWMLTKQLKETGFGVGPTQAK
jgi:hypothetical protein